MLVVLISKSKKLKNLSNFHLHIQNTMKRWELNRQKVIIFSFINQLEFCLKNADWCWCTIISNKVILSSRLWKYIILETQIFRICHENPLFSSLELFRVISGVILYGCPGTGKTLLAKAVANQTSATFLRVVGSELIQKYLGDGPKMVRELFRVAEEHAPVFTIFNYF